METKNTGFASPAQGYEEQAIDLNSLLIQNAPATYFFRLDSDDMAALGLARGSLLVVDRSKDHVHNSLVLIRHEGQFLCRLYIEEKGKPKFTNGNTEIIPIIDETEIIGTITASIKEYANDLPH